MTCAPSSYEPNCRTVPPSVISGGLPVVLTFLGPSDNGHVNLVEQAGSRAIVKPFNDPKQLISRLDELAEAWRVKTKERRYTQAFREKHYDFLRRYVELKTKIDRAINEGPG